MVHVDMCDDDDHILTFVLKQYFLGKNVHEMLYLSLCSQVRYVDHLRC